MDKKIIAGNWKMNKTNAEAVQFCQDIIPLLDNHKNTAIICAPFTCISSIARQVAFGIGAQNMYYEEKGAYTGEITASMLCELGVEYVILGHSERRHIFMETDELVNKKVKTAISHNITPIFCIGETKGERESGRTISVLEKQIEIGLKDVQSDSLIVAYEPVWAIGTGLTADTKTIEATHIVIKEILTKLGFANNKLLYGGSVNEQNCHDICSIANVDGVLVGGASLSAEKFAKMINEG